LGNGTGIKLTTARYFTPSGRSIQVKGITPDIVVEDATLKDAANDNSLNIREGDLENHLVNGQAGADNPATIPTKIIVPEKIEKSDKPVKQEKEKMDPAEVVSKNDFQFNQALNLLKGLNILQPR
jgi:carboxyl-terminal processing protease